jgi:hypothetical protein
LYLGEAEWFPDTVERHALPLRAEMLQSVFPVDSLLKKKTYNTKKIAINLLGG